MNGAKVVHARAQDEDMEDLDFEGRSDDGAASDGEGDAGDMRGSPAGAGPASDNDEAAAADDSQPARSGLRPGKRPGAAAAAAAAAKRRRQGRRGVEIEYEEEREDLRGAPQRQAAAW